MVGQGQRVGSGLDLGESEVDGGNLELVEDALDLVGVVERHQQERLHSESVIGQRPGAHRLADDGHLVAVLAAQEADGLQDTTCVLMGEQVGRNHDVIGGLPDGL